MVTGGYSVNLTKRVQTANGERASRQPAGVQPFLCADIPTLLGNPRIPYGVSSDKFGQMLRRSSSAQIVSTAVS
jgi:hypothetical protein